MPENLTKYLTNTSRYIFFGLLAYMPFHILVSTVLGVELGVLDASKALKDVVLFVGFSAIFMASISQDWFKSWLTDKLVLIILAYALFTIIVTLGRPTDIDAEIIATVYNLRFLLYFLYGWLLTYFFPAKNLGWTAVKIVLGTGLAVVVFGLIQYFVLPDDALTKLGFTRDNGVLPAFFIDDKPDLERVMSTLRDPNSLGAYLVIILSLVAASYLRAKKAIRFWWLGFGVLAGACLYLTFSRSAWIGAVLGLLAFGLLAFRKKNLFKPSKVKPAIGVTIATVVLLSGTYIFTRNTYFVKNVLFHADQSTMQESPNQLRLRFWQESIDESVSNPLGSGPGSVGIVSAKDDLGEGRLTENYYLQILGEVGILGLVMFMSIVVMVGARLYGSLLIDNNLFVASLIASLIGISFSGLLNHIWINEAVAYTWWGLAGLYFLRNRRRTKFQ